MIVGCFWFLLVFVGCYELLWACWVIAGGWWWWLVVVGYCWLVVGCCGLLFVVDW